MTLDSKLIQPNRIDGIPWCRLSCVSHTGHLCSILGHPSVDICQPAVMVMASEAERLKGGS